MKIPLIILAASLLATGCESPGFMSGKVIDAETQQPLADVQCMVTTGKQTLYTDSTGAFDVSNASGPCQLWGKKEISVEFSREGYATQTLDGLGSNKIARLQHQ